MCASIVITAGGTGGHIFPALALAEHLRAENDTQRISLYWLGTRQGMEAKLVPDAGIAFSGFAIQGIRGKSWFSQLCAPWRILRTFLQARRELKRLQPALVVAFGGYVTGPVGLAAYTLKIPVVLHEQNAAMGLTNRCLQRLAARVCLAFPIANAKVGAMVTGNPVRRSLSDFTPKSQVPATRPLQLLILGGSQGALAINTVVPAALALLKPEEKLAVWHQAGKDKDESTRLLYQKYEVSATVNAFIDDMAKAYAWADLVIARAGAMTVSEIAMVGVPSILIPYPAAVDDHQTANARYLADTDAAYLLPQAQATPEKLADILQALIRDKTRLVTMAMKAGAAAKSHATEQLWQVCLGVLRENTSTNSVTES